ncbi:MAG: LptE family protein [Bacteroides sp.]|jgi:outer membrane lipopolysaccharide assembly protein LptE/RlpB|nr:LptE family protein [Bacteroides sp.]
MQYRLFSIRMVLSLALLAGLAACGVYSFTGASIPPEATTFSVSYFPNNAQLPQPTLSQRFTEALQDKFLKQTNLRMVDSGGDLHLEGSITGYTTAPAAISGNDQAALNRLTITVRVTFINEFEPDNDFERSFSRYWDYDSNLSLSQVEDEAITVITEALVEDIFNQAVVNW